MLTCNKWRLKKMDLVMELTYAGRESVNGDICPVLTVVLKACLPVYFEATWLHWRVKTKCKQVRALNIRSSPVSPLLTAWSGWTNVFSCCRGILKKLFLGVGMGEWMRLDCIKSPNCVKPALMVAGVCIRKCLSLLCLSQSNECLGSFAQSSTHYASSPWRQKRGGWVGQLS